MRTKSGFLATAILTLAMFGCSKPPLDLHLKLDAPTSDAFSQYKLVLDGVPGSPIPSSQPFESTVHAHNADSPQDMLPHIEASVLSVCGWQPAKVEMHPPSQAAIEQARKDHQSIPVFIYLDYERPTWQQVMVLVDNRGGAAGRVAVGDYGQDLPADSSRKLSFPYWPHCDQAKHLLLNGEAIGNIEEDINSPGTALPLLLDTSGERCYRYEWKTYGRSPGFGGSGSKTYTAQRLRALSSGVDYFLHPLQSVEFSTDSMVQKSSLNEISCKEAK
ncbi:MAG TPA: hypothetical protein VI685_13045 [Candidatus Angelobacter sp.]